MARRAGVVFRWIVTLLVIGAGLFLIWKFIINRPKDAYENPLAAVKVEKPYRATVQESLSLTGYIEAQAMIPVVPFVQGTITGYYAKAGDYVNEGDVLAQIDSEPYELQAKQAEAVYLASDATFTRVSNLYEAGAATKQNYDEAKAALDAYKAQYDLAMVQLGYATVTAPKSGTILMADSAEGSIGTSTSPLYVIADLDKLQINLNVPERYYDLICKGIDSIQAIVSRDGTSTTAHVDTVAPYISPTSKTFNVKLFLDGDVSMFRPGMYVDVARGLLQADHGRGAAPVRGPGKERVLPVSGPHRRRPDPGRLEDLAQQYSGCGTAGRTPFFRQAGDGRIREISQRRIACAPAFRQPPSGPRYTHFHLCDPRPAEGALTKG